MFYGFSFSVIDKQESVLLLSFAFFYNLELTWDRNPGGKSITRTQNMTQLVRLSNQENRNVGAVAIERRPRIRVGFRVTAK